MAMIEISAKRIERKRLSDQVIDQIVDLISSGKLKVGDMLPSEPQLMKLFGVGRGALREATGALSLVGLLTAHPGKGTRVIANADTFLSKPLEWGAFIRDESAEELIEARIILEEAVAGVAARQVSDEDIKKMESLIEQTRAAKGRLKVTIQNDLLFHQTIAKASHNRVLMRLISELSQLMQAWMEQTHGIARTKSVKNLIAEHTNIVESIKKRSAEEARSAMRDHLVISSRNLRVALIGRQIKTRERRLHLPGVRQ